MVVGIIIGCMAGPAIANRVALNNQKPDMGGEYVGGFSDRDVETLPLTPGATHPSAKNPLVDTASPPPLPDRARPYAQHRYAAIAPAVIQRGSGRMAPEIGHLAVGETVISLEEKVDTAGLHWVRFRREVEQASSFQEGWTTAVAPDGTVQLQRLSAVGPAATSSPAEELSKVRELLAKHGLAQFEAQLRGMGGNSPVHLAQLRPEDLQSLGLNETARRSFEALAAELEAVAIPSRANGAPQLASAQRPVAHVTRVDAAPVSPESPAVAPAPAPSVASDWQMRKDPVSGKQVRRF